MFRYQTEQKVIEIKGIKIGGQVGETPPVLIGSIFYHKHKIVKDDKRGIFDRESAERLIKRVEELYDKTKIPYMFDVVGSSHEAIVKYIEFVSCISQAPILIDALGEPSVAKAALSYVKEVGLQDRVIYNSLTFKSKDEEYAILRESGVDKSILLLYTDRVLDLDSRLKNLEIMLEKTGRYGIDKVLIDTFVIDIPSLGAAIRAGLEIKRRYGLPVGCGAHNAISTQRKAFKERLGPELVKSMELAANLAPIVMGFDFLLYGPIEASDEVFAAVYTVFTSYRYLRRSNLFVNI